MRNSFVHGMAAVRFVSAAIELSAAVMMLRLGRVDAALRINGILGLVGPAILITVTALGIAGMAGRLPLGKVAIICAGVYLIVYGSR